MKTNEPETITAEIPFYEDMSRKARWFYETRGHHTDAYFQTQWQLALDKVQELSQARFRNLDPFEGKPGPKPELLDAGERLSLHKSEMPEGASHLITDCWEVRSREPYLRTSIRMPVKRSAYTGTEPGSERLFHYDEKLRQWNLVEHSGYNKKSKHIWGFIYRPGRYAAMALPANIDQLRQLALLRFAHQFLQAGQQSSALQAVDDYFDKQKFDAFRSMLENLPGEEKAKPSRSRISSIYRESQKIRQIWPERFPNNGLPQWQILDDMYARDRNIFTSLGIADIIDLLPFFRRLANRVGRWYSIGPDNINGRIKSLAIHPGNGQILYAGAANGGVWKSTSGGNFWSHLWKFEDTMAIGAIAVAPSQPNTLYAATGEDTPGWGPSYGGTGIYKSTNAGQSWNQIVAAPAIGYRCNRLQIHPSNPNIVYVATEWGVYKTTTGDGSWTRILEGHITDLVMDPAHPNTLYAGVWNSGVWKTTTGDDDWNRISGPIVNQEISVFGIVIYSITTNFPVDADAGWIKLAIGRNGTHGSNFIVAKMGPDSSAIFTSADGGAGWFPCQSAEGASYNEWTNMIAVNPVNERMIYAGGVGMRYSENGGISFTPCSGTHADHHAMVFDPADPDICYVACDGGVYRSTNAGRNWSLRSQNLTATQLVSIGVSDEGSLLLGGATQDQGIIQTEGSHNWNDFGGGNEWGMFIVDPNNRNNIYISPGSGRLRRSTDAGRNYSNPTGGLTDWWAARNHNTAPATFNHLAVQPGNSNVLIAACILEDEEKNASGTVIATYPRQRRIYYSSDQGSNWQIALPLTEDPMRVAFAPSDGNRAYAATSGGRIYRSNQGGQAGWLEPYTAGNRPPAGVITCICVHPTDPDIVYITYGNINPHVYRSTDGGAHWDEVAGAVPDMSLPDIAHSALVIDEENTDILYVATDIGVFRSNDAGNTWYYYNDSVGEYDLPKVPVIGLALHPASRRLFAATLGRGVYETYTSGIYSLRVLAVSHYFAGRRHLGIQFLRVTDRYQTWVMSRLDVIRRIEAGTNAYTIGADGSRAEVRVMQPDPVHPLPYLKTPPDVTEANNLLSMPEF